MNENMNILIDTHCDWPGQKAEPTVLITKRPGYQRKYNGKYRGHGYNQFRGCDHLTIAVRLEMMRENPNCLKS